VLGLMMAFGAILFIRSNDSPPLVDIHWGDFTHAATVVSTTAIAIWLYTTAGFVISMSLLMIVLLFLIERRSLWRTLAVSIGVTVGCYVLFGTLLKSPLPPMPFWQ
jgi:hypothetical protein